MLSQIPAILRQLAEDTPHYAPPCFYLRHCRLRAMLRAIDAFDAATRHVSLILPLSASRYCHTGAFFDRAIFHASEPFH